MRIQNNIAAMNAHRVMGGNSTNTSKSLEKLSSGFRINRAGDDAAGLAISEKMRAQIKGLETAQKNANDGISLVQTAEGALTEVHSMLNRMTELATQSANGTYDDGVDRANLQKEIESLKSEIDRISDSTNYNGIKLLDGSLGTKSSSGASVADGGKVAYVASSKNTIKADSVAAEKHTFGIAATSINDTEVATITYVDDKGKTNTISLQNTSGAAADIEDMINNHSVLGKLFFAESTAIASRTAGADAPRIISIDNNGTGVDKVAADSKDGRDAGISIDLTGAAAGDTLTIGDKTYEFAAAAGDVTTGNIEIVGLDAAAVLKALQREGVTSASVSAGEIVITDLDQISVAAKGNSVSVDSVAGAVSATAPTKNAYGATFDLVGTAGAQTLTLSLIDQNGEKVDIDVNYTGSTTNTENGAAIRNALNNNTEFNKYFEINTTSGAITARDAGTNGAQLSAIKTTDNASAIVGKINFTTTTVGKDSQKTLSLDTIGAGTKVTVDGKVYEFVNEGQKASEGNTAVAIGANVNGSTKNLADALRNNGVELTYENTNKIIFDNEGKEVATGGNGITLQVGESSEKFQKVSVKVDSMGTENLGIKDINVGTQEGAAAAMDKIKAAINTVSSTRGDLGAIQNRLEHTMNNLGVAQENMTAAESRIRDVDMAKEMMNFTKNNILVQASQAMLAQANQQPQGVLQLLR